MTVPSPAGAKPLTLRRRADLRWQRMMCGPTALWCVQDPLALRNYQLRDEEQFVWSQLDGRTSLSEIQSRFHQRFRPRRISSQQLHWFVATLHREGLVVSDAAGQGTQLLERRRRSLKLKRFSAAANPLAIRFRGLNPDRLLRKCYPSCRWLFTPWAFAASLLLIASALGFAVVHAETLWASLPALSTVFTVDNVIWLAAALCVAKVLHELAHGLTCYHFGGKCRELGVMLLVFTPCLYCNVSDAWLLPSKWQRIAISAAGIYIELVVASLCLFLWYGTEPGLLNSICLNLVLICSLNTLLFNGNPLLRFDGYFILADLLGTPNLNEQAWAGARQTAGSWLGIETVASPLLDERRRWPLACYAVAAGIYRVSLLFAILWFCHRLLAGRGLAVLSLGFMAVTLIGVSAGPVSRAVGFFRDPAWSRRMKRTRTAASTIVLLGLIAMACSLPLPSGVRAPAYIEASGAVPVYVPVRGQVADCVVAGQAVRQGQVLATLRNLELDKEIAALRAQRDLQRLQVQNLQRQQIHDRRLGLAGAAGQLPSAREALADLQARLEQKQAEQGRLTIRAPRDGMVLPPRRKPEPDPAAGLQSWTGTPLEPRNRGCQLEPATVLCSIGPPDQREALLVVSQQQIQFVRRGQSVGVRLDAWPRSELRGQVVEISEVDAEALPPELIAKGLVGAHRQDAVARPAVVSYRVRVELEQPNTPLPIRAAGRGKIQVAPRTLANRAHALLCRVFRLEL